MKHVTRVGVSFPPELLEQFDAMIEAKGYDNRSEAVRDLVRKALSENALESEGQDHDQRVIGTLTIIYDHHASGLTNRLLDIEHEHHDMVPSKTHFHMDGDLCLEVLFLRGRAAKVRDIANRIKAEKGVKYGELVLASPTM